MYAFEDRSDSGLSRLTRRAPAWRRVKPEHEANLKRGRVPLSAPFAVPRELTCQHSTRPISSRRQSASDEIAAPKLLEKPRLPPPSRNSQSVISRQIHLALIERPLPRPIVGLIARDATTIEAPETPVQKTTNDKKDVSPPPGDARPHARAIASQAAAYAELRPMLTELRRAEPKPRPSATTRFGTVSVLNNSGRIFEVNFPTR